MWKLECAEQTGGNPLLVTLNNFQGRQVWKYYPEAGTVDQKAQVEKALNLFAASSQTQKHSSDELLRLQCADKIINVKFKVPSERLPPAGSVSPDRVADNLRAGISFYEALQQDDGHWPGDYGGPMFLMPGLIISLYTTGSLDTVLSPQHKLEMIRYLRNHQNDDGGFGLHIEGHSTMFGTVLSYISLRILGIGPDAPKMDQARKWIHERKGAHWITSWGKFWLAVLGVFSWDGINPLTPEMWLLPHSALTGIGYLHPGRFWCHCRMVYLPMSYIYGKRTVCKETPLTKALREELYPIPYSSIDFNKARNQVAKEDLYYPHPLLQDVLWWALYQAEGVLKGSWLRKTALEEVMEHIHYEDEATRYVDIGPVNKVINMLCCWVEDPDSTAFKMHLARVPDYLWVAEDGMKMQGYNGSQLWDTAFAVQALAACQLPDASLTALQKAYRYIDTSQVREEPPGPLSKWYRHISKGAWPFSTRDHGWPISDCTSEGFKAALQLGEMPRSQIPEVISDERLFDAVEVMLSYQNSDGGWATYENTRSFHWLELLNPSETFGDIMVDYSYVECSSACMTALGAFTKKCPDHRTGEIAKALKRGEAFIRSIQRPDGSWYGSWAVCFTYGIWFGVNALVARGYSCQNDGALMKACEFLLEKQKEDGGWGESYLSSQDKVYSQLDGASHVVNTGWAMLALINAGYHKVDASALHKAAHYLLSVQQRSGDWPQQHISGVFNRNCMITYANYRNIFPIWALGLYRRAVLLGEEVH